MKKLVNLIAASLFSLVLLSPMAYADKWKGELHKGTDQPKPAFCVPASGSSELNLNNVRARINTGGDMWWDFETSKYEIPKGSRKTSMFSGALWIGGLDVNGQLKLAALKYRQAGNDYWTGPLTTDGTASIDQSTCKKYDKHWKISRAEVEQFIAYKNGLPVPEGYTVPRSIKEWPAHPIDGNPNQSFYLAPFYDKNGDNVYNYDDGDYPYYDFANALCPTNPANIGKAPAPTRDADTTLSEYGGGIVKGGMLVDQVLKGDQTIWWVFNDKGAAHTESKGEPIGLEIRAQAFSFATNDEINNMTFYSYEIINRSTYTLTETYFSQWVDTDLGDSKDDFVGCDVRRGLGYCYNGKDPDGSGQYFAYGKQPPAIGVDFFQGPYMDPDGYDSPNLSQLPANFDIVNKNGQTDTLYNLVTTIGAVIDTLPVIYRAEAINGVNFGDGIVDNERFGMRRFVFHNNSSGVQGDPDIAFEYYNMLKGIWRDNTPMCYGGNAYPTTGGDPTTPCAFMFPGDTDPWNWGTFGKNPGAGYASVPWTEENAGNFPEDRRFMQSAGPFTLYPGAVNYITVGIPWARAASGGPFASVQLLRRVDDKCQTLFDNCFKVLDGPDAPGLAAQELDKEVILYISNSFSSNNYGEKYIEFDPSIPMKDDDNKPYDQYYHFEGYQIFQLSDASVSISDIYDADKARVVFQCDVKNFDNNKNAVGQLVNYTYNDEIGGNIPQVMVQGGNEGILHSVKISEDKFASGDKRLVNHKKYYYIAVSYAYNNFLSYSQDPNVTGGLNGQKRTYLAGRKAAGGASITPIVVIPHIPSPEANGTQMQASYGDQPQITRVEGQGNGGLVIDLTQTSIDKIMSGSPWKADELVYLPNKGPLNIKVVDPLKVQPGEFLIKFVNPSTLTEVNNTFHWEVSGGSLTAPISSNESIALGDEQIITDLGIAIQIKHYNFDLLFPDVNGSGNGPSNVVKTKLLESSMIFANPDQSWLTGVPDVDGDTPLNWIRSGTLAYGDSPTPEDAKKTDYFISYSVPNFNPAKCWLDADEQFEKVINRTWAPFQLVSRWENSPGLTDEFSMARNLNSLYSVDIVLTADRSKWSRCPVVETCDDVTRAEGGAIKLEPRIHPSVDQNGNPDGTGDGMGWFPGYAINIETGERLNVMFGEDSWLVPFNGKDMKFNPTSQIFSSTGDIIFGGKHFLYIMGHQNNFAAPDPTKDCPAYDEGAWLMAKFNDIRATTTVNPRKKKKTDLYTNAMWTSIPLSVPTATWLSNDVKIRIRVARPYKRYLSTLGTAPSSVTNDNFPLYKFNTTIFATETNVNDVAKSALDLINVVPNPYYGFSMYETNQLDNRIKIVNLPVKCTISIYAVNGSLVRQLKKDDNTITSLDWDLKNHAGIPISGGVYIIHVKADGIGEKVIKWFGALRPTDLNSF